ncbi:Tigger transposable element-derived protein 6, partial [Dictyocoela muelleri]
YITLHGEAASADLTNIKSFKKELKKKLESYNKEDIFNIDETSLYIKSGFNKSYVLDKNTDNKNIKQNKTRLSLMLGVNIFGEKLKPLVIGKSKNPRALKYVNLETFNLYYRSNKTSWLTSSLFYEYINNLNEKLFKEGRKILLLLDNFSGHKRENMTNIELMFFPPNCTSIIQPLDAIIINSFKFRFKTLMNNFQIHNALTNDLTHSDIIKNINLLNVINWIEKAFEEIKPDVIKNCWKKTEIIENFGYDLPLLDTIIFEKEESSSCDNLVDFEDVVYSTKSEINISSCKTALDSLRKTSNLLMSYQSKYTKEYLDLQDKIISEYLNKFYKDKLDFYFNKNNNF